MLTSHKPNCCRILTGAVQGLTCLGFTCTSPSSIHSLWLTHHGLNLCDMLPSLDPQALFFGIRLLMSVSRDQARFRRTLLNLTLFEQEYHPFKYFLVSLFSFRSFIVHLRPILFGFSIVLKIIEFILF